MPVNAPMEIQDHPFKIVHYCLQQGADTWTGYSSLLKNYFMEGWWEVGEEWKGIREWMVGEESSDIEKTGISKPEVPVVISILLLPPPPFKQLYKQSNKCSISERITLYYIWTGYRVLLFENLLLFYYKQLYSAPVSEERRWPGGWKIVRNKLNTWNKWSNKDLREKRQAYSPPSK